MWGERREKIEKLDPRNLKVFLYYYLGYTESKLDKEDWERIDSFLK